MTADCKCAPSLLAMRAEATRRFPGRNLGGEGCCASAAHHAQNPNSDHETGDAEDTTHDPAHGLDAHAWADWLRLRCAAGLETRVAYIISAGRIAGLRCHDWSWRHYSGTNAHEHHTHVSLNTKDRARTRNDLSPWFEGFPNAAPTPAQPADPKDDDDVLIKLFSADKRTTVLWSPSTCRLTLVPSTEALAKLDAIGSVRDGGKVTLLEWKGFNQMSRANGGWYDTEAVGA